MPSLPVVSGTDAVRALERIGLWSRASVEATLFCVVDLKGV